MKKKLLYIVGFSFIAYTHTLLGYKVRIGNASDTKVIISFEITGECKEKPAQVTIEPKNRTKFSTECAIKSIKITGDIEPLKSNPVTEEVNNTTDKKDIFLLILGKKGVIVPTSFNDIKEFKKSLEEEIAERKKATEATKK